MQIQINKEDVEKINIIAGNTLSLITQNNENFLSRYNLIFADPPFTEMSEQKWLNLGKIFAICAAADCQLICESNINLDQLTPDWNKIKQVRHSNCYLTIYEYVNNNGEN